MNHPEVLCVSRCTISVDIFLPLKGKCEKGTQLRGLGLRIHLLFLYGVPWSSYTGDPIPPIPSLLNLLELPYTS